LIDQRQVVEALLKPETYEEDPGGIDLVQTHISFVFLTRKFVYKVKKAVYFGFLDFTSLEKRRYFCEKELELNRRLCGDMYLEVVPINKSETIKMKGEGEPVEYAVKMKRMPQEKMMIRLLEQNKVSKNIIEEIAKILAEFHSQAEIDSSAKKYEIDPIVEINWEENFEQTEEFIGTTVSKETHEFIRQRVNAFIEQNMPVFRKRMAEGKVRNCHGDVHSGNIIIADRIYIFDAIEISDRMSHSDVAGDVGFLAMDLDFMKKPDLSRVFVESYVRYSGDRELGGLLQFYKCYRAYVRGKVVSFRLNDPDINSKDKNAAKMEAEEYFKLSSEYASKLQTK
jgi:hypothetical protein